MLHSLKLTLLEVAEDVETLQEEATIGQTPSPVPNYWIWIWPVNVSYLLSHECLAVLQVVPLHDGSAVKFGQRRCTPTENKYRTVNIHGQIPTQTLKTMFWLALSGRDCWFLCGRYRGRKRQPPWQRYLDLSSTFSASLSVEGERNCGLLRAGLCGRYFIYCLLVQIEHVTSLRSSLFSLCHVWCYLQQAEHGVADIEAVPPVVVSDGTVTLPHGVHPPGQCLRGSKGEEYYAKWEVVLNVRLPKETTLQH